MINLIEKNSIGNISSLEELRLNDFEGESKTKKLVKEANDKNDFDVLEELESLTGNKFLEVKKLIMIQKWALQYQIIGYRDLGFIHAAFRLFRSQ